MLNKERVCVFVDGSSFYFGLKANNRPTRTNYHELAMALVGPERHLIRIYYYNAIHDSSVNKEKADAQKPFYDSLDKTPYLELRLGRIIEKNENFMEKGVDVKMATDMVYGAGRDFYDTAILLTEDSDFSFVIRAVKDFGKHVELGAFLSSSIPGLMREADKFINLLPIMDKSPKIFPPDEKKEDRK